MKMAGAKQVHYESGPNMTPLVDVVMVILIFLMLAGSFGSGEHYMVSSASMHDKGSGGGAPPPGWVPPVLVEVQINPTGGVRINGRAQAITDNKELTTVLAGMLQDVMTKAGRPIKEIELVLRPDGSTEWEKLAPVYDAGLRAKFEKIGFAASR
jgi:biopolymer transport protein ExbD